MTEERFRSQKKANNNETQAGGGEGLMSEKIKTNNENFGLGEGFLSPEDFMRFHHFLDLHISHLLSTAHCIHHGQDQEEGRVRRVSSCSIRSRSKIMLTLAGPRITPLEIRH